METVPDRTQKEVVRQFGESGLMWLEQLPQKLQQLSEQWELQLGAPFLGGLAINLVYACQRRDQQLVLKLGYPHPEFQTEITVLQHWQSTQSNQQSRVQLIAADREAYAYLMARVSPGTTFRGSDIAVRSVAIPNLLDRVPVKITAKSRLDLAAEADATAMSDENLPHYRTWCDEAFSQFAKAPSGAMKDFQYHIRRAQIILDEILSSNAEDWILHGDLHHENMVLDERGGYVAIDPKGVRGPKILEYGRFIHNFLTDESQDIEKVITLRLSHLPAYSHEQLLKVAYLDYVLALTWTLNSGGQPEQDAINTLLCLTQMLKT